MNIKEVHDVILFYLKKDQQGFVTHAEIDEVLDRSQMALFNKYHSNPVVYTVPGKKEGFGYGDSLRMDEALAPFKSKYTFLNVDTPSGIITLPSNHMHIISLYTTTYVQSLGRNVYNAIQVLNEEELIDRLNSQVIPVGIDDPVAILNSNKKIQVFPEQPASGAVFYFRRPAVPRFGYTVSGRTITYVSTQYDATTNPNGSQELEWNELDKNNVIIGALSYYGINLMSSDIVQFAENKINQGQ
jgi:hypothetical protein